MKKIWTIEIIVIIVMLAIEPTATALNIIMTVKFQNKTLITEHLLDINNVQTISNHKGKKEILKEINEAENKTLVINKTIGFRKVRYWEHKIKEIFYVKNDSILLHIDPNNNNILYYQKTWTDIQINFSSYEKHWFEPDKYYWKKIVIFPDYNDCKNFYTFNQLQKYPIVCLEVRHTDGTTIMYNQKGEKIGKGIPAPSYHAFSLSGYDKGTHQDPWHSWRSNADRWFRKWFETTICIGLPTNQQVSEYISNPDIKYFYEIAHSGGEPTRFQTNGNGIYYTADQLHKDMENREPIRLAIFCSCEAMRRIDNRTLSYEISKGETKNTVTIGYVGMGNCSGWHDSLDWQNSMFIYIDRGFTVKNAFLLASSLYPKISDCVRFVGDEKIKLITILQNQYNMNIINPLQGENQYFLLVNTKLNLPFDFAYFTSKNCYQIPLSTCFSFLNIVIRRILKTKHSQQI